MSAPPLDDAVARFHAHLSEPDGVVLEGFHTLKHALRFGADVTFAATSDPAVLAELAATLAPDIQGRLSFVREVSTASLVAMAGARLPSPVIAVARRSMPAVAPPLAGAPSIFLYDPRHAGNAGAVIRVAAAAGAARVQMSGDIDPWARPVVRAAAGLHFAIDVSKADWPPAPGPKRVAFDPDGDPLSPDLLSGHVLVFGSERRGLPDAVLAQSDHVVRLPMTEGVSSLNLATSVSAALYVWRMTTRGAAPAPRRAGSRPSGEASRGVVVQRAG